MKMYMLGGFCVFIFTFSHFAWHAKKKQPKKTSMCPFLCGVLKCACVCVCVCMKFLGCNTTVCSDSCSLWELSLLSSHSRAQVCVPLRQRLSVITALKVKLSSPQVLLLKCWQTVTIKHWPEIRRSSALSVVFFSTANFCLVELHHPYIQASTDLQIKFFFFCTTCSACQC